MMPILFSFHLFSKQNFPPSLSQKIRFLFVKITLYVVQLLLSLVVFYLGLYA